MLKMSINCHIEKCMCLIEMIIFKFTFLLALNKSSEDTKERKNRVNNENKEEHPEEENKNPNELKTSDFVTSLRIEYELLPKKFKYSIDINCWKNIVKISSSDAIRYYNTLECGHQIWFPVSIHHFLKEITEDELVSLHSHVITFNIVTTKRDMISKFSILYCLENESESEQFVEYFEADPNKPENIHERVDEVSEYLQISNKCVTSENITSWLKFTGNTHCCLVYDTISSVVKGEAIKCKNFLSPSDLSVEMKAEAKSKTKKQTEKIRDPYFVIPGEVFFTDPSLAIYALKDPSDLLSSGYIFLSVKNLMTREQKTSLNLFIVKIKKLDCLPADLLERHGYKQISISYDIPFLAKDESPPKPLSRTIHFNESRAYITKDIPRFKYLEFLRSEKVAVHIKGIQEEKNDENLALFGTLKKDVNFSQRLQPREAFEYLRKKDKLSNAQTLALASYDLSSLLKNVWIFRQEASCYHPDNLLHGVKEDGSIHLVDILTIPEINLANIEREKSSSPLLDGILASELTTLDMEFYFLAPQFANHHLQNNMRTFKRFFITFFDLSSANRLLASILQHNQNLIGFNAVLIDPVNFADDKMKIDLRKRKLSKQQQASDESLQNKLKGMVQEVDDVITGFLVDNGTEVHIFVEGISHGYILEVWNKIHKINTSVAKVFLNSETEFEKRIYEPFMVVGIYTITLKIPLMDILAEQGIYVRGLIPLPCFKALQKLNLLLQTETLQEMLRQDLFPSTNELVSLNLELGVPMRLSK